MIEAVRANGCAVSWQKLYSEFYEKAQADQGLPAIPWKELTYSRLSVGIFWKVVLPSAFFRPQTGDLPINNGGYTIERGYLGKTEAYNDIANWSYADLPKVFRRDTSARSYVVKTVEDLQSALTAPNDTMIFVESIMDPHDALAPISISSNKGAELDYGPRGPQRSDNQLQPAVPF
jgi:hypothetical protein